MTDKTDAVADGAADPDAARPILRVVRGDPAPEELAALTAVITASAGDDTDDARTPVTGRWAASTRVSRPLPRFGPGAWAASSRR